MLSSPHSLFADCSFLKQLSICSHCAWDVPSPRPWAACGQEGLVMWPQMNLLPVAALSRSSWPSRDDCASRASSQVFRGSQRMLFGWDEKTAPPCLTLQVGMSLPFLSSAGLQQPLLVFSNKHTSHTNASLISDHLSMWIGLLRDTSDLNSIKTWALLKRKKADSYFAYIYGTICSLEHFGGKLSSWEG